MEIHSEIQIQQNSKTCNFKTVITMAVCDYPFFKYSSRYGRDVPVPCGRCPNCKLRRINGWVFRLMQEERRSIAAHFVTFTYDTEFVPISANGFMTLRKSDFQDFMKRLRKLCDTPIKYYVAGEYGSKNKRPHYHAIIFNVADEDLYFKAWALGGVQLGGVHVGAVTSSSISYTAKYIDKQEFRSVHGRDDRVPEFSMMSKHLGDNYLTDEVKSYHRADVSRVYVNTNGYKVSMPRYYRDKIFTELDREAQAEILQASNIDKAKLLRKQFDAIGYPESYNFYAWIEAQRAGRANKYYSSSKNRDL